MITKIFSIVGLYCFLVVTTPTCCVVVGFTGLENGSKKVAIMFDKHDMEQEDGITRAHGKEIETLLERLQKNGPEKTFYVEHPVNSPIFGVAGNDTIHIPIKKALAYNWQQNFTEYQTFDKRTDADFWIRDIVLQTQQFQDAVAQKYNFPASFYDVTVDNYLKNLDSKMQESQQIITHFDDSLQKDFTEQLKVYDVAKNMLAHIVKKPKFSTATHFLDIVGNMFLQEKTDMFVTLTAAQSVMLDLTLLDKVIKNSSATDNVIVYAGGLHAQKLETNLMTMGFKDVFVSRNLKAGLKVDDLAHIEYPKNISPTFVAPIYEFFTMCSGCGATSTKKCTVCKRAYYCSVACQKTDWSQHKLACKKTTTP
ncbi:MAG: zinc finger MYND domain-containing protein [Candidatus Babeliaceae bacterium]